MPALRVGDVVRFFDGTTDPPKHKRFLCVCVADGWFLRINSKDCWNPKFHIPLVGNEDCLEWDSYLELRGVIEYDTDWLQEQLRDEDYLGPLSIDTLQNLVNHLRAAKVLTIEQRELMVEQLSRAIDDLELPF